MIGLYNDNNGAHGIINNKFHYIKSKDVSNLTFNEETKNILPFSESENELENPCSISQKIQLVNTCSMSREEFDKIKKMNVPIAECYVKYDKNNDHNDNDKDHDKDNDNDHDNDHDNDYDNDYESINYTCVYNNGNPLFVIKQHSWGLFSKICISNDDRFIVLVWSRYIAVFSIEKQCCIYMCDHEGNGLVEEIYGSYQVAFGEVVSIESYSLGIVIKHTIVNIDDDENIATVTFF